VKTIDEFFIDWELLVFGYGYGYGEEHILTSLKDFMATLTKRHSTFCYDYVYLTKTLGAKVTWLLINILCHADILEYGTSSRYGWLTQKGINLYNYLSTKTIEELCIVLDSKKDEAEELCSDDYCQCSGTQIMIGCKNNPFFS